MTQTVIALLGRRDQPTDAVEEYCRYLGSALQSHEIDLQIRRVPWEIHGWSQALKALALQATGWRDKWVLVQYTALAWSARGFPSKFLQVLRLLKTSGALVGVVYHDVEPFVSPRLIDQLRQRVQRRVMRKALSQANLAIFTVPPEKLSWISATQSNLQFIPVGPNLPFADLSPPASVSNATPTVGVFSITGGAQGAKETRAILDVIGYAAKRLGGLRLSVFGRHAETREADLRQGFRGLPVELNVQGVLESAEVVRRLSACNVLFFVRGGISSRRGSAIAGIAAGLPVLAYENSETAWPITEAGVLLAPLDEPEHFKELIVRVLSNRDFQASLALRSRKTYESHFAWPVIAARYAELLKNS